MSVTGFWYHTRPICGFEKMRHGFTALWVGRDWASAYSGLTDSVSVVDITNGRQPKVRDLRPDCRYSDFFCRSAIPRRASVDIN
jgi:hypothetical protein